jgi:cold shock CspA family protein
VTTPGPTGVTTPGPTGVPATGTITAFDAAIGIGQVHLDDASVVAFHATSLTDGSRSIEVGTDVTVFVVAGRGGQREASRVAAVTRSGSIGRAC